MSEPTSADVAQMDAIGRLSVAIKRIAEKEAEIERLNAELKEERRARKFEVDSLIERIQKERALNAELTAALKSARGWMPIEPIEPLAKAECARVDAVIAQAEGK